MESVASPVAEKRRSQTEIVLDTAPPVIHDWLGKHGGETLRAYRIGIAQWLTWCAGTGRDPLTVARADCDAYATHLRTALLSSGRIRAPRTQARLLGTASSLYEYIESETEADTYRNPFGKVNRPDVGENSTDALTDDEARRFLLAARKAGDETYAAASLLAETAMRASGLLHLKVEDLRIADGRLIARIRLKGGAPHDLPMPTVTAEAVEKIRGERTTGYLLTGARGRERWTYDELHDAIVAVGRLAGLPHVTPHVLRTTWITSSISAGESHVFVKSVAGHKGMDTTLAYDRRSGDLKRRAEAMDRVSERLRGTA